MSEKWINQSKKLLKVIETLSSKKGKDRLETVNSMILTLNTLTQSVHGWRNWIQNLPLMSKFTEDELREMEEGLKKRVLAFIEYDIEVTKQHKDKLPKLILPKKRRTKREETKSIYV